MYSNQKRKMNPSKEVGEASGEATGIGETMEAVVTTVEAMTSVVDAVEAMVMAVEMREWLEVGRSETERITATHFFSRALAVQKRERAVIRSYAYPDLDIRLCDLPLYWPGLLPGLVQLLADCLLPHNSKAIQSGAMLSIKYLISCHVHRLQLLREVDSHDVSHLLLRLVRVTVCTEIRDQACLLLRLTTIGTMTVKVDTTWVMDFLPHLTDLVHKYAAIMDPTEAEISSLNTAVKLLRRVYGRMLPYLPEYPQPAWEPHFRHILPDLVGIIQKPGKRKKAQIKVSELLAWMLYHLDGNFTLESGVIGMLLETLRVGKEPTAVLVYALQGLCSFFAHNSQMLHGKTVLDMGALGVFHLVLKRPNDRFKCHTLWDSVIECLSLAVMGNDTGEKVEVILSQEGLLELILELGLGLDLSMETEKYHLKTRDLLCRVTEHCSLSQLRRLMSKESLFRVLCRYLNFNRHIYWGDPLPCPILSSLQACLARSSVENRRILRRLCNSIGITDTLRRFSLDPNFCPTNQVVVRNILDTYLTNPLPPLTPHNLPFIIYTRNAPY